MLELLTSILGGAIKSLATKGVTAPVEKLAKQALDRVDGRPVGEAAAAVSQAVEAARRDLVDDYWAGEDALSRDVVALLEHPPFAEEVARRLLFRGQPDFDRLRRAYLSLEGSEDRAAAGERWQALQGPLAIFFEAVEQHLETDPHLGPLLRDSRRLAALGRLEAGQRAVAEASREIQRYQGDLVAIAGDQKVTLGQILELLRERLAADRGADRADGEPAGPGEGLQPAEKHYLRLLRRECNRLPLADDPRDVSAERDVRPELANVYVDLETTGEPGAGRVCERLGVPAEERPRVIEALDRFPGLLKGRAGHGAELAEPTLRATTRGELEKDHPLRPWAADRERLAAALAPLTALEALAEESYLVLLGDPGSGKSTFVNHLAIALADGLLGDEGAPPEATLEALGGRWFPVRILLRRWSAGLKREAIGTGRELELLYAALDDLPGGVARERWLERFDDSRTLVLFDGLDEVPAGGERQGGGFDRRRVIVAAVEAFRAAHPACRVVVTCRVKPYREGSNRLAECPTVELAPLDDGRVRRFCRRWYEELARVGRLTFDESAERRERLLGALGERPVLREMAGTPLLLTMLARVNARAVLPDSRAELYDECVEQLLWEWERQKAEGGAVASLAGLLDDTALKRADFEWVLWRLTFEAHGRSGREGIVDLPFADLRQGLAEIHPERDPGWAWANRVIELMRERGGLLVESETGVFTFPHRSFQEYLACRWLLEKDNAAEAAGELAADDVWGEVILLACGYLGAQGSFSDLQAIVAELVAGCEPRTAEDWRRVLLAGRAWRELGPHRARGRTGEELGKKIPRLLTGMMQDPGLPAAQRLEGGLLASDLGALPPDLDTWVEIPMDQLDYPFRIGKYPVTHAQYQRFAAAGGYDRGKGWFSEEGQKEILEFENAVGDGKWPTGPRLEKEPQYNRATQPVVGVSWYEAAAYAAWLTGEMRTAGEIGDEEEVRLPAVAEWQRAAGGAVGRKYSWKGDFDARRANTRESKLNRPTPVHMYPAGATPEGVFDLTGNVWEWTADEDEDSKGVYLAAGGAWWNDADRVGAAARSRIDWYHWNDSLGFRVVVVPISRAGS